MRTAFIFLLSFCISVVNFAQSTFFNEVNYLSDDPCLEIISIGQQNVTNWSVVLYDGQGIATDTIDLEDNNFPTTTNGYNVIDVDVVIMNAPTGGHGLVDANNNLIQFLSYGATITATDGPAVGQTSEFIGTQTDPDFSLQLTGAGSQYNDFIWELDLESCLILNNRQEITSLLLSLLPVELGTFNATKYDRKVAIEWTTLSEINNFHFIVERSTNGGPFREIGRIEGAGTSTETLNYSLIDSNPEEGYLYYRLKQIDFDGIQTVSDIVVVEYFTDTYKTTIFPNPAADNLWISLPEAMENVKVEVFDLLRRSQLYTEFETTTGNGIELNLSDLKSGHYVLRVRSKHFLEEHQFIKIAKE